MAIDLPQERLAPLAPLAGDWTVEATWPSGSPLQDTAMRGTATFDWALGGAFLLQRMQAGPPAPDMHALIGPSPAAPDGFLQHYFDSRGVVRLYEMTFDGRLWRLERYPPPPDFAQRFRGELSEDGATITGAWEIQAEAAGFAHDFSMVFRRA
jgi:hypothetical protein